jgi:hypothetical protein
MTLRNRRRGRRWGSGFINRRIARAYAESVAGVHCGLGFAFRRGHPRR